MPFYDIDYELIAEDMLEKNYSHDQIIEVLIRRGLEPYSAEDVLGLVLAEERKRQFWRGLMVVTGALITLGVVTLIGNALQRGDATALSFSVIPLVFGMSMVAYALRKQ